MCASTLEERLDKTKHIPKTNLKISISINTDNNKNISCGKKITKLAKIVRHYLINRKLTQYFLKMTERHSYSIQSHWSCLVWQFTSLNAQLQFVFRNEFTFLSFDRGIKNYRKKRIDEIVFWVFTTSIRRKVIIFIGNY